MSEQEIADCPICLLPLSRGIDDCQSLQCGHVFHASCLVLSLVKGMQSCCVCRTSVNLSGIKNASAVPACIAGGVQGLDEHYKNYAMRSLAPIGTAQEARPPNFGWHNQRAAHPHLYAGVDQRGHGGGNGGQLGGNGLDSFSQLQIGRVSQVAPAAADRRPVGLPRPPPAAPATAPAPTPAQALAYQMFVQQNNQRNTIMERLGLQGGNPALYPRLAPAPTPMPTDTRAGLVASISHMMPDNERPTGHPMDDYVFVLDVSASMGKLEMSDWTEQNCSRLALALTYLACFIGRAVSPGDSVTVICFDWKVATIMPRFIKPPSFDIFTFMNNCKSKIVDGFDCNGTNLYEATILGCAELEKHVQNFGRADGAEHCLVVLTDGKAMDPRMLSTAHREMVSPRVADGFKALLIKINEPGNAQLAVQTMQRFVPEVLRSPRQRSGFESLAFTSSGVSIPYVTYQEVEMPTAVSWGPSLGTDTASTGEFATLALSTGFRSLNLSAPSIGRVHRAAR